MTAAGLVAGGTRWGLDTLISRLHEPGFVSCYRRAPVARETHGHVSPTIIACEPPRSKYVRKWRRHARRCADCASVFRYYGLSLK